MWRSLRAAALVASAVFAFPSAVFAGEADAPLTTSITPHWLPVVMSALGLMVAVVLLLGALQVRKSVMGGVIADKMYLVVLAIICLAAASLANWSVNFMPDRFSVDQAQFAAQLLMIVAMALLAAYFYAVNSAMKGYMRALTGAQQLAAETKEPQPDPDASRDHEDGES